MLSGISGKKSMSDSVRLQKYMAECGVGSRRTCEQIIMDGRVSVDGNIVTEMGVQIDPTHQRIEVDGKVISTNQLVYIAVNKPDGIICTSKDPMGRPTVLDIVYKTKTRYKLPKGVRLYTIGRLDLDSEGLILVTNDGSFANLMTHPRHLVDKEYLVWADGQLTGRYRQQMVTGMECDGQKMRMEDIYLKQRLKKGGCYHVTLREGKKRQIRRMFKAAGLHITKLRRIRIGSLALKGIPLGSWRMLTDNEITKLKKVAAIK